MDFPLGELRRCASSMLAASVVVVLALSLSACGGSDSGGGSDEAPPPPPPTPPAATIGPQGGSIGDADGVRVHVPARALAETLTLRIARDTTGMNAALLGVAPDPALSVDVSPTYALTPHGTRFAEPAELRIPLNATAAAGPGTLAVLRTEPGQASWELMPVLKLEGGAAVVAIDGFSYYKVVRVVQMPPPTLNAPPAPFLIDMAATLDGVGPETFTIPSVTFPNNQHRRLYGEISSRTQNLRYAGRIVGLPARCASISLNGRARFPTSARAEDANGGTLGPSHPAEPTFAQTTATTGTTTVNGHSYPTLDFAFDLNMANAPYQRSVFEALRAANNTGATPTVAVSFNAWASCTTPVDMGGGNLVSAWKIAPGSEKVHDATFNMDFIDDKGWVWNTVQYKVDYLPQGYISHPSDVTVAAGAAASFSTSAWPTPVGEQRIEWWRSNNEGASWTRVRTSLVPVSDTADTFTLPSVTATDHNALFRARLCTVPRQASVAESCTDGLAARLSVIQGVVAASFVQQPRALLVRTGQTASFSVQVAGAPAPTLRWQSRPANFSAAWSDVVEGAGGTGATTAHYSTAALGLADNGLQLRAVASNPAGEVASAPVTVSVSDQDVAPSVLTQPASLGVVAGSEAVFAVVARGTEALSYQWRRNGQPISGAHAPVLKLSQVSSSDASVYSVQVSNAVGSVTSADATLQVSAGVAPAVAPSVVTEPAAVQVNSGNTATFAVGAAGTGPLSYQWLKNGQPLAGATAAFHSFTAAAGDDGSGYSVVVSNGAGSVTSAAATLTVRADAPPTAVSLSTQPSAQVQLPGGSATFAVAASGTGPLSYQWLKDGAAIPGATAAVLLLESVSSNDAASYRVTVSNALGSVDSASATLTVVGAPVIGTPPASVSVVAGGSASFSVAATGGGLRYQWTRDHIAIAGATSATYTTPALALADNGAAYGVIVYNGAGIALSAGATVTVTAAATPLTATAVTAGFGSSYAVDTLGDVWAWGYLVDPVTGGYKASAPWAAAPVRVQGLFNVKSVVVVSETGNVYALHTDGSVSAWGRNDVGQLGDGTTTDRALPVKVLDGSAGLGSPPITGICLIAAGASALAMTPCDGHPTMIVGLMSRTNFGGATGSGLTPNGAWAKVVPGLPGGQVLALAMPDAAANAEGGLLVAYADNGVWAWGAQRNNSLGAGANETVAGTAVAAVEVTATFSPSGRLVNRIDMGRDFTLVRWAGGAVRGIGRNVEGQLGSGDTTTRTTFDYVSSAQSLGNFSVGQVNVAALVNGNVWIWGWHNRQILTTPTQLTTGGGFAQLSLGDQHGLLIDTAGRVQAWGDGSYGALGTGQAQATLPVLVMRP